MKEISIYDYYAFGYNYNNWRSGCAGKKVSEVLADLKEYIKNITALELQVTVQVIEPLNEIVKSLEKLKGEDVIPADRATRIEGVIEGADKTLDAELQLKTVLSVTPKRFNIDMLLASPKKLLAQNSWDVLSENAKMDFSQATRCIAMSLSTAAAFHLMRCVEEMVKMLYLDFIKQKRMTNPMWASMIDKLRNKNQPKPSSELLDQLDMIRANFRNPTQHPQKYYDIDEAQDLLNSSIVAINGICREIARHNSI
ncbi:MAG: hypothetical protein NTZ16_10410 [Verrucomicrobia bacterium]|nr:hypothetical protein [Verrucomicrobiota bacterium]